MLVRPSLVVVVSLAFTSAGCYTVTPQLWSSSVGTFTYQSTSSEPITIAVVDTRSSEEIFRMDIPVGQRFAMHFDESGGDDPVLRPSKMSWSLLEGGTTMGSLSNTLSVPPASARRIDYSLRPAPEFPPEPPQAPMRAGESASNPEWATPRGGPAPAHNSENLYR